MKFLPIALALLAALPAPALAQEAQPSIRVSYADLNLASPAGVAKLDRRLAWAIHGVCAAQPRGADDLARQFDIQRCVRAKTAELAAQRNQLVDAHRTPMKLAAR